MEASLHLRTPRKYLEKTPTPNLADTSARKSPFPITIAVPANQQELAAVIDNDGADFLTELEIAIVKVSCHSDRIVCAS
jgi:hypothetical protein